MRGSVSREVRARGETYHSSAAPVTTVRFAKRRSHRTHWRIREFHGSLLGADLILICSPRPFGGGGPHEYRQDVVRSTAQLMDYLPWSTFDRIVARYDGNRAVLTLPCATQYQVMAFAQCPSEDFRR